MTALRRGIRPLTAAAAVQSRGARTASPPDWRGDRGEFSVVSLGAETLVVWQDSVDLRQAAAARLTFESQLHAVRSRAAVQVSVDGVAWETVLAIPASDRSIPVDVDLDPFAGQVVHVRIVFEASAAGDTLSVRQIRVLSS